MGIYIDGLYSGSNAVWLGRPDLFQPLQEFFLAVRPEDLIGQHHELSGWILNEALLTGFSKNPFKVTRCVQEIARAYTRFLQKHPNVRFIFSYLERQSS